MDTSKETEDGSVDDVNTLTKRVSYRINKLKIIFDDLPTNTFIVLSGSECFVDWGGEGSEVPTSTSLLLALFRPSS